MNGFNLSEEQLKKDVRQALRLWHKVSSEKAPFSYLFMFKEIQKNETNVRKATNQLLSKALAILQTRQPRYAEVLNQRYIDGISVRQLVMRTNSSESSVYHWQREAITHLAKIISELELELRTDKEEVFTERQLMLEERLGPPSIGHVIGMQSQIRHLTDVLTSSRSPWIVCISGIGGIGKTTLADTLLRQIISQGSFDDFGWVSAQKQVFNLRSGIQRTDKSFWTVDSLVQRLVRQLLNTPTLRLGPDQALRRLRDCAKEQPHLIVLDNLETLHNIDKLIPTLRRLVNPTKFLLTSRHSLHLEPDVYNFTLSELSQEKALKLIREEAQLRNLPYLVNATNGKLARIYNMVGGNPLALRLIVGQTHIHDLETILDDLKEARGNRVQDLYTHIYRRAWNNLDEISRHVFLMTPLLVSEGENKQFLQTVSGLSLADVNHALDVLVTLNLVNVKKGSDEWLYSIHSLTRTFLEKQVLKWQ